MQAGQHKVAGQKRVEDAASGRLSGRPGPWGSVLPLAHGADASLLPLSCPLGPRDHSVRGSGRHPQQHTFLTCRSHDGVAGGHAGSIQAAQQAAPSTCGPARHLAQHPVCPPRTTTPAGRRDGSELTAHEPPRWLLNTPITTNEMLSTCNKPR